MTPVGNTLTLSKKLLPNMSSNDSNLVILSLLGKGHFKPILSFGLFLFMIITNVRI